VLIAGLMHVLLPKDFIRRHMGGRGPASVFKAVLLGVPMPLCSCGVIPAAIAIKREGATDGASVGFLISTPQIGIDSILVAASFLGWPFALFKVGAAFATGVLGGVFTDIAVPAQETETQVSEIGNQRKRGVRDLFDYAVNDLIYLIWRWLLFGIVVSAAITTWVPSNFFADTAVASGVLSLLVVLVISLPLYVCATASVPIAAALVAAGMPAGAAIVFLMAGPASNVATIGAVYKAFGARVLGIYLSVIVGGSLVFGYLFDFILETGPIIAAEPMDHGGFLAAGAAVLLMVLFGWFAVRDIQTAARRIFGKKSAQNQMKLDVTGMSCGGCAKKATSALLAIEGVSSAEVDHESGTAVVGGMGLEIESLTRALDACGYTATAHRH
jgi:uncharacterized membrane protein YraQ (UPF0718 family)/copper chaperone CopZ